MSGQWLFEMYVRMGLCTGEYRWAALSPIMRGRWDALAKTVDANYSILKRNNHV